MFDIVLRDDLIEFRKGTGNINDVKDRYLNMKKIIVCRTRDKIYLIQLLLKNNIINKEYYEELYFRAENDYRLAQLYLMGLVIQL